MQRIYLDLGLVTVLLNVHELFLHVGIAHLRLGRQVNIDISIKGHLLANWLLFGQVAEDAHQDRNNNDHGDREDYEADKGVEISFSGQLIEIAFVFRRSLYFDCVSGHHGVFIEAGAHLRTLTEENGLD